MVAPRRVVSDRSGNGRNDKATPRRDVQPVRRQQPNVPINPSAFIPPALEPARIDKDRHVVRCPNLTAGVISIAETGVTAWMLREELPIDEHDRVSIYTAEIERDDLILARLRDRYLPPIPGGIHGQVTVPCVGIASWTIQGAWLAVAKRRGAGRRNSNLRPPSRPTAPPARKDSLACWENIPLHRVVVGQMDSLPSRSGRGALQLGNLRWRDVPLRRPKAKAGHGIKLPIGIEKHQRPRFAPERITRPCIQPQSANNDLFVPSSPEFLPVQVAHSTTNPKTSGEASSS